MYGCIGTTFDAAATTWQAGRNGMAGHNGVMLMDTADARKALEGYGFIVGVRDPLMNTDFSGAFMVAESYEPGHTQQDGSGGVWCVVGDDLDELVAIAFDFATGLLGLSLT